MKQWKEPSIINLELSKTKGKGNKHDKTDCCNHNITQPDDFWHPGNHEGECCQYKLHHGLVTICS